jgi:prepilin-type N-terminal cleavage/methylation domain-containing protein
MITASRRHRRVKTDPSVADDAGVTLVELLVTVAILGIAFVAVIGGMTTSIMGSDIHRKQATAETVLRNYAEALKPTTTPYTACATPTTAAYAPATLGVVAPSGYTASIADVEYWDGNPTPLQFVSSLGSCGDPTPTDNGMQRISLQVTSSDGRATERIAIVKRKP